MVLRPGGLADGGEQVLQMPTPSSWVVAGSQPARGCPTEHGLDAASQASGRLSFGVPDRGKATNDQCRVDLSDRQVTEHRACVRGQRVGPLIDVLRVPPASLVGLDVGLCTLIEGHRPSAFKRHGLSLLLLEEKGVITFQQDSPSFQRLLPGLCQAHGVCGPQAHAVGLAFLHVSEQPALDASLRHLQREAPAIPIEAGLCDLAHLQRRELVQLPRHEFESDTF